jgi:hypothetical protein
LLFEYVEPAFETPVFLWRDALSGRLITAENADLKMLYQSAFTSQGAGLVSSDVLQSLLQCACDNEAIPTMLECYRLKNGQEIPVPESGISYPLYQQISQGLSRSDRVNRMTVEFNDKLDLLLAEPDIFGFDVWFE